MSEWLRKTFTPSLAKVLAALALPLAVIGATVVALRVHADWTVGVHHVAEQDRQISYVDANRRMVRSALKPGELIVCSEGPRQLQSIQSGVETSSRAGQVPNSVTSTIYLREAGWQLCLAYANGVIDKDRYAELLGKLVLSPSRATGRTTQGVKSKQRRRRAPKGAAT